MAAAVCRLFDDVQLDIGPATDTGFYYDFDLPRRLGPEDFESIEAEMARIVAERLPFERLEVDRGAAEEMLTKSGQKYKLERLADIPEGETITFYRCGDFIDLCRGPHLDSSGKIQAFKLLSVAGSYYRGIETNPMLQRIYGIAGQTPKELKVQLRQIEEAKKRDHRKLGLALDLFSIQENTGPGLIHWHPKGARVRAIIEEFWRQEHFKTGYDLLYTPHIGRAGLWEKSGHLDFYRENMYSPMDIDGDPYFVRPMNCPFHIQVYKAHKYSYRDLPLRWAELGTVYRYEKSGVLHGLLRVRGFTQDDAHIICTPEQVEGDVREAVRFALRMWKAFGFSEIKAHLATKPAKAVGDSGRWDQATRSLENALKSESIESEMDPGGGAFYGPKIDMKVRDAIGRLWQMTTIQFDFNMPERFDMTYVGEDGKEHRPYIVHRALLGSLERFFGVLIEHYAGAFPLWLAPEQVRVLPLTDRQHEHACDLRDRLRQAGYRSSADLRSETVNAKIRDAQLQKVPYMLVLGPKEQEAGTLSVRSRAGGREGEMSVADFLERLKEETGSMR
ncbi:MAG: threonine--tRNA ligase [Lentisphaerales bacterium]|nr:MAG: threonine--tRNA ligase [Lentisphaerales bacterium]